MKLINIGKIVSTHGIKGEMKIISKFKYKTNAFKVGNTLYIGENKKEEVIDSYRTHKNYDLVSFRNYNNINEILKYMNNIVYVNSEDLNINELLDTDLIGLDVYIEKKFVGKIINIIEIPNNSLFEIKNNSKIFYIPNNKDLIENIDIENKKIIIKYVEGLIE